MSAPEVDIESIQTEAGIGFEAGRRQYIEPTVIDEGGIPFSIVPGGCTLTDMERYLPHPVRAKASPQFLDVESFCAYMKDFGYGGSKIFASLGKSQIIGALDYHTLEKASWCDHNAYLQLPLSPDWIAWMNGNRNGMSQVQFAEFIEEYESCFVEPSGAAMLTLAQNLSINKNVVYKSSKRLSDGSTQFTFTESVEDNTVGEIKIPEKLVLGIQPYRTGDAYKVTARLRYRLDGGRVTFSYILDRPDKILEDAFSGVVKTIGETTEITPYVVQ